jgi:predicted DNA-binding transcriptional regulator YafY
MRIRFAPEVSDEVREMTWHPKQKIESSSSGEAILELPAESIREARRFVLAFGKEALVLSPRELVEDLRRETAELARSYRAAGGAPDASGPDRPAARGRAHPSS